MKYLLLFILLFLVKVMNPQTLKGKIVLFNAPVRDAVITTHPKGKPHFSDTSGSFELSVRHKTFTLYVHYPGCITYSQKIHLQKDTFVFIQLIPDTAYLQEINIESTQPLLNKKPGVFNTEIYDACILKASSASNLFEGTQNISGLRPQFNCNVCNAGDIHINGMEGPYTNVLIDGMPVIGGIASIYGLFGISADIIESVEINRYPGSVLYGIDNIGGTINVITKKPIAEKTAFSAQLYSSSYLDNNITLSSIKKKNKYGSLNGMDIAYFDKIFDENKDGFTDVALQKRLSVFHKSVLDIRDSLETQLILRVLVEDRWGGQIDWNKKFRGTDSIYGENIWTDRYESIIKIPLSIQNIKIENNISYNYHHQNSYYGTLWFEAKQHNLYYQSFVVHSAKKHKHVSGIAFRYLNYKDNTVVFNNSTPYSVWYVPAIYTENTLFLSNRTHCVLALRYDYHNIHKHIFTPRLALLYTLPSGKATMRSGITTGFRPVQLFTEDHAALTGARKVVIEEKLLPEKSYAAYYNIMTTILNQPSFQISADINTWYMYFSNRIVPDYSHADKILYYNLNKNDFSINKGFSIQLQSSYKNKIQSIVAFSLFDNYIVQNRQKRRVLLSEPWSTNWTIRWNMNKLTIEYTGSIYGKMTLPKAGNLDPRPDKSPVFSIQNIQIKYSFKKADWTIGIKNLLNFTPDKNIPFLIARAHDPFDKKVLWDDEGNPVSTQENPYALTFDPTYTYASMQKRRVFFQVNFRF
ncbi:MAG: hypothetical protein KatS3mg028_0678 [Bacteroidia bacterium]|nr:MAG: hypothetical protein KatS3mg028_0678 [Bacteroidia bacterium]